jgi:hypothetical protein
MEPTLIPFHPADCGWHRDWHDCGCGLFNTLVYVEPGEGDSILTHYISVEGLLSDRWLMRRAKTISIPRNRML